MEIGPVKLPFSIKPLRFREAFRIYSNRLLIFRLYILLSVVGEESTFFDGKNTKQKNREEQVKDGKMRSAVFE